MDDLDKETKKKEILGIGRALTLVYQIGFTIIFSLLFFIFIGKKLDDLVGTKFLFTIIGMIFGVIGGGYVVYREIGKI